MSYAIRYPHTMYMVLYVTETARERLKGHSPKGSCNIT